MKELITLKGNQVYSQFGIQPQVLTYTRKVDDGAGNEKDEEVPYHRCSFNGKNFTCTPELYAEWKAGKISELNIVPSTYTREVDGEPVTMETYRYAGHMTFEQELAVAKNTAAIKEIDLKLQKTYQLTAAQTAAVEAAL